MINHLTRGFLIRGIVFISIVITVAAYMMFGDIPNNIYWAFIISTNITYHTTEYIIRLRRDRDMYKITYEALLDITKDLLNHGQEVLRYASNTEFLAQFDNEEDLV